MTFEIIPAIDILDGKCVRLEKGDYSKVKIYSDDPLQMATKWQDEGYKRLHVVDLNGARSGLPENIEIIKKIAVALSIPVQVGGGIRNIDTINELIDAGLSRIILGTVAFENLSFIKTVIDSYGDKIAVSIDAHRNIIVTKGWIEKTSLKAIDAANKLAAIGVKRFIYTDISKDGMMKGPNFAGIKKFASSVPCPVIASGGVSSAADIEKLSKIKNVEACIVGKAFYEGKI